ncbi:unnamed protein product [Caenorhabditis brenneri]
MPAIQFKSSASNKAAPKASAVRMVIPMQTPPPPPTPEPEFHLPQLRKNRFRVQFGWVRHSRPACSIYLAVGVLLTTYYCAAFLTQYGTLDPIIEIKPIPTLLQESVLTRVIMLEWLLLGAVLLFGIILFRRIFMPIYIYIAIMATNGTLVLFVVKFKQFTEGKIAPDDISLNLIGILLVTATTHNLIYLYAMHLHLSARFYSRVQRAPVAAPAHSEMKQDLSSLP